MAPRGPGCGVEFKGKSASHERQNTKRQIHHGSPASNHDAIGAQPCGCKSAALGCATGSRAPRAFCRFGA
jgi:hypothetical protein